MAESIFRDAPQVHILVTSRESLRAEGEQVYHLAPLELGCCIVDRDTSPLAFPAVQLFVNQVYNSGHAFELTDADAPIAAEICRRLDGIVFQPSSSLPPVSSAWSSRHGIIARQAVQVALARTPNRTAETSNAQRNARLELQPAVPDWLAGFTAPGCLRWGFSSRRPWDAWPLKASNPAGTHRNARHARRQIVADFRSHDFDAL